MGIIVVTATHKRPGRLNMVVHLRLLLDRRRDVTWIVAEDGPLDPELAAFLPPYARYLGIGPTRDLGHAQRNLALEHIRDGRLEGVVYNADDDNYYDPRLFDEVAKTRRVSFFPVGNLGPRGVERPLVLNGRLQAWDSGWPERKFPVDMAGFAFHSSLLHTLESPIWSHSGRGGESEFISKILESADDAEFLCDSCTRVFVWHNELRRVTVA